MNALTKSQLCFKAVSCGIAMCAISSTFVYAVEHKCQEQLIQKPDSLYQDNFDGSVTDTQTGLIWQKCSLGYQWNAHKESDPFDDSCDLISSKDKQLAVTRFDWQGAKVAVESINSTSLKDDDSHAVWRLPEAQELMSLADPACSNPAINADVFPATQNTLYWTATELEKDAVEDDSAYLVYFSHASQISLNKQRQYAVRLVKAATAETQNLSAALDVDAGGEPKSAVQ